MNTNKVFNVLLNIIKRVVLVFVLTLIINVSSVSAGWFTIKSPKLILDRKVEVIQGERLKIPIIFIERSQYNISFNMEPKVNFHSNEGKKIKWGGNFKLIITVEDEDKTYITHVVEEALNYNVGYGLPRIKVPGDVPKNKQVYIEIYFEEVDSEYSSIYKNSRVTVSKLPYFIFLD